MPFFSIFLSSRIRYVCKEDSTDEKGKLLYKKQLDSSAAEREQHEEAGY